MAARKKKSAKRTAKKVTKKGTKSGKRSNVAAKKPANRSARTLLKAKVVSHELLGLADVGGMCRMLLTPTHRLDRPAHDSAQCDQLAKQANAIDHFFVPAD